MNEKLIKKILNALPGEPGIMDSSGYPRSAVLAALYEKKGEPHLIFQKRNTNIRQGGEICFPGGRYEVDRDRSMLETAVRETMEEMGVGRDKIEVLGHIDTLVASMGAVVHCFLGEMKIEDLSELNINSDEVERVFSVPLKWFMENPPEEYTVQIEIKPRYRDASGKEVILLPVEELGLPDRYREPWGHSNRKIYVWRVEGETIWGMTAQMTRHITGLLRGII
ncbi:NUDIX hydrolase [Spirochaeta isovalerica]|uniref:8-oxo-dGTP pyrophosphatase MutT (NUDIX family) n=1 Tax=Spirochaeta isovalerica TaxID=150 RepID=A0A841RIV7_9SPIO|nr:CoA pyrophosphatase [Spirochaeta isovalerica]MBB6482659.1 8-oxo-dGTP pyrophosphatase MutT (NUDIX family) [Spirochaeta isovalerica]